MRVSRVGCLSERYSRSAQTPEDMSMSTIWILVSDAARGRLFEASNKDSAWTEITCYTNSDLRGLPKLGGSGRSTPRTQESTGAARHVIEPHTSYRDKRTHAFAHTIVSDLLEANAHQRYDQLYLVAPPHFLGVLREQIGDADAARVAGELASDLVALTRDELRQHLHDAFPHVFRSKPARAIS